MAVSAISTDAGDNLAAVIYEAKVKNHVNVGLGKIKVKTGPAWLLILNDGMLQSGTFRWI